MLKAGESVCLSRGFPGWLGSSWVLQHLYSSSAAPDPRKASGMEEAQCLRALRGSQGSGFNMSGCSLFWPQ